MMIREALRDLIDAIPETTLDADPPLRVWVEQAESTLRVSASPSESAPSPTRYRLINGSTGPDVTDEGVDHPYAGPLVYLAADVDPLLAAAAFGRTEPPPLREALEAIRWKMVLCGGCGLRYRECVKCGTGVKLVNRQRKTPAEEVQCGGHADTPCDPTCIVGMALAAAPRADGPPTDPQWVIGQAIAIVEQHRNCGPFEHGDCEQCYVAIEAQLTELREVVKARADGPQAASTVGYFDHLGNEVFERRRSDAAMKVLERKNIQLSEQAVKIDTLESKLDAVRALAAELRAAADDWTKGELSVRQRIAAIADQIDALPSQDRPQETSPWQPMATAPKRKKVLVSWINTLGHRRTTCAIYYDAGEIAMDDDVPDDFVDMGGDNVDGGWFEDCESRDPSYWPLNEPLTHWMPLPLAPQTQETP